jgi:inosine triphosphate pyrophosphatase
MQNTKNGLFFITGNKNKFLEIKSYIPSLQQFDKDLPEIQSLSPFEIIQAKIIAAFDYQQTNFIVEDTSLYCDCLNGLPGPLIKWFLKSIGNDGIYDLAVKLDNIKAEAKTIIGFAYNPDDIIFFEGSIKGAICPPRGKNGFGWDPIFVPSESLKTLAEMSNDEKIAISMRSIAIKKLISFIENKREIH